MNKEIKVGILGIVSLVVLYFGFNFLKGLDAFSNENEYHVQYKDVQGLQNSNPVTYKGVVVGRVLDLDTDQENDRINVTLSVKKDIKLTDQTIAILSDDGLIGGKLIKLDIKAGKELANGAALIGGTQLGLAEAAMEKITPALNNVDSLIINLTKIVKQFDQTGTAMKTLMASANQTTDGVNKLVANNAASLSKITANAAVLTSNLNTLTQSLDSQIKPILTKTDDFTTKLNTLQLNETVSQLNSTIAGLQGILADVNGGEGTLGKLTSDDSLYLNLENTAGSLNLLLEDMKKNPRRYVHFSLFGGKDKSDKKQ